MLKSHNKLKMFFNLFGRKTRKNNRKGPTKSATSVSEGTVEWGNDEGRWVAKRVGGSQRWVPFHSASMFGYMPLTANYLAKHIDKPVKVFERSLSVKWPRSSKDFDVRYTFTPTGDVEMNKGGEIYPNWLKKQTPPINKDQIVIVGGDLTSKDYAGNIQVGLYGLISSNLMNTDAFVKCPL